ncbi:endonuclease/exonuclease/phosphatase family protein [Flavivirga sp. 57AJ16]|uniref:endonuclease/exonuclease/phosphatase family protein n=1 Tax=Flavivirga sp. 57AJ16 TaxID=3025307 RepID=UPI002366FF9E|nr:endonuclease/exonuclease/phosphatase family protein [Flavivirga sp. 57AJ16]MDD7884760.1 endonuclease/exonuclease/phosphatase family protein [Flavivirga sp. 57AJ16]
MKTIGKKVKDIKLIVLLLLSFNFYGQTSIMTYNIRFNNPNDNVNWWKNRKEEVAGMIKYYHPDILGIQEGLNDQVNDLYNNLPNYSYTGVGRDDGKEKGEYAAIFYNSDKFELINTKTYWLSSTPNKVSVGWDASMERITTYGVFRNLKTNDTLHVFNCHYDHIGKMAQQKSSELIVSLIRQKDLEKRMVIVMGDLNSTPKEKAIQSLKTVLEDSFEITKHPIYGPVGTFNTFDIDFIPEKRIDYIFTKNLVVENYRNIDDRRKNNLWLSDHLPVFIEVMK